MRSKFCACGSVREERMSAARPSRSDLRRLLFCLAFANAFECLEVAFGFLTGERVVHAFAVSAQVDRIENGQRAADTPHESDAESNQRRRTKGGHTLALRSTRRLSDTFNQFRVCG